MPSDQPQTTIEGGDRSLVDRLMGARFRENLPAVAAACAQLVAVSRIEERERIAAAIESEANVCPCEEDAKVLRETATLVRANFSYEDAERLRCENAERPTADDHSGRIR